MNTSRNGFDSDGEVDGSSDEEQSSKKNIKVTNSFQRNKLNLIF